ncbi:hypothetical protein [Winogradskyella psychrotolerans]|uniref:hypothetical protein n=1 Tax=Winogradskyella psychrotolerans TaxID=1344585 RepID=UPI001C076C84|nr:hypothetical protein [Winogradskyella psychrotolerans]MBU2927635.1 hypothetical protein [Winogradskyella psychrotolerans]
MKIITLYSDVDEFIITAIVGLTALMFIVNWVSVRLKEQRKKSLLNFKNSQDDNSINVNEYALNFKHDIVAGKSIGIISKLILVVFAIVIVIMPLHEFVVTLRPVSFFYVWTCFPF